MSIFTSLLVDEKEFFIDINRSKDVTGLYNDCAILGLSCFCVIVLFSGSYVLIATANWWATRACGIFDGSSMIGLASASRNMLHADTHQSCGSHGVTHLAVIMDGNRRYGRRIQGESRSLDADKINKISELCQEIFSHRCRVAAPCGDHSSSALSLGNNENTVQEESDFSLNQNFRTLIELIRCTVFQGHYCGGDKLLEFILYCVECDIKMVTVYAFSTENWNRPVLEVNVIMTLFMIFFHKIRAMARRNGLFIRFVCTEPHRLPACVLELMHTIEIESRGIRPRRITVNVCVSYSGKSEIVKVCNKLLTSSKENVSITNADMDKLMLRSITQDDFEQQDESIFSDSVSREPELLIRTSGESRISNFLLYEVAYSELIFMNKTWPEITKTDLIEALRDYAQREKRLGR